MSRKTRAFGYWIASQDEASAREAVKMAGLPILVLGGNGFLFSLLLLTATPPNPAGAAISALIAILLVVLAFRIRAGRAAWVPLSFLLFCLFIGANAVSAYLAWAISGGPGLTGAQIVMGWIVPLICLILSLAGLRGWIWLRANGAERRF